jgi:cyclopropane fatty-acyl-phospholipid synthase-like methyltransferase
MSPPTRGMEFDRFYRSHVLHWIWSDIRIPPEVKALVRQGPPLSVLELGCGVGRFSRYVAQQGMHVTGVDFSPAAIARARASAAHDDAPPEFLVGDVTRLESLTGPFDVAFDVGCFHCLNEPSQQDYASEVFRLLKPGGTHLIWALDSAPSDAALSPAALKGAFAPGFALVRAQRSRRRLVRSHWYWLVRSSS